MSPATQGAAASATAMHTFVQLSALLTGIAADKLAPPVDPVDIKQAYFDVARQHGGATFDQLLDLYASHHDEPPATVAALILEQSGDDIAYLARSIMLAWYLGSWYDPAGLRKRQPFPPMQVISASAYTQGWAWNVAQAHPMGYSNLRFGYWAQKPPSLADYVGGPKA